MGCAAIELAEALAAGGGGGCWVGAGSDPLGNSGKNGSSGLGNSGAAGGGGGGGGGSATGGGAVLSGKRGWWRILLGLFCCWPVKSGIVVGVGEAVVGCGGTAVKDTSNERRMKKWYI